MAPLALPAAERRAGSSEAAVRAPVAAVPAVAIAPEPGPVNQRIGAATAAGEIAISLDDRLKEVEANLITWALQASGGNKSKAAELLHIKRSTLGDRITRCGLGR
jgi:DNA-binding NtrC family response regulator